MTSSQGTVSVGVLSPNDFRQLAAFAEQQPLLYNDFGSIAALRPAEPKVWAARSGGRIVAAAIDDGLAMSVGGDLDALRELSRQVPALERKLVIAGPSREVRSFVERVSASRRERPEHFMVVSPEELRVPAEPLPLRIATSDDLELLAGVRAAALEEEYGMKVERGGELFTELYDAVVRAVEMQGVAIWVEDGKVAFTAQLIAKTPHAAMFGDLYTDPAMRGEGRATRALATFCVWLMSESQHVTLRVGTNNLPAVRLYERVGFAVRESFLSSLRIDD